MKEQFLALLKTINREGMNDLIDFIGKTDFYFAPASTRFHGNFEGGLLEHSLKVYEILVEKVKNCSIEMQKMKEENGRKYHIIQ